MKLPKLIGLSGRAGVGKNLAADLLAPMGYEVHSFAAPIYAAISAMTHIPVQKLADREFKEQPIEGLGFSPRQLMQTLGTEWARNTRRDDFWVRRADMKWNLVKQQGMAGMIMSDVRFDNEARWIIDNDGIVLNITRLGVESVAAHSSENGINPKYITHHIHNDGTIDELRSELVLAVTHVNWIIYSQVPMGNVTAGFG